MFLIVTKFLSVFIPNASIVLNALVWTWDTLYFCCELNNNGFSSLEGCAYISAFIEAGAIGYLSKNKNNYHLIKELITYNNTAMKNQKILIVDDDVDVINVLQTILEHEGYQVLTANDKKEGLALAYAEKPNLVICDVMMTTQYEGFELAKELTTAKEFEGMPVIMQSSIEVLTTSKSSVQEMAREFRMDPQFQELQVLLIKDAKSGVTGIDYKAEDGSSKWLNVSGFLRKPVDSSKLIPEISRLLNS